MLAGITNGKILLPDRTIISGSVFFENGKIKKISKTRSGKNQSRGNFLDARNNWVFPGFIDIHCHGAMGHDVMDATPEALEAISAYHAGGGTTAFLATTASSSTDALLKALENIRHAKKNGVSGALVLGAHIEGPYFAFSKRGCHLPKYIRNPEPEEYSKILGFSDCIVSITLAPEIEGSKELIKKLAEKKIIASLGHSEATYDDVRKAVGWGASHVTHMYCAMSGIIRKGPNRLPGLAESTLLLDDLTTEVIADGLHLPSELIRLIIKTKGTDHVCVVTDAMRGAGMPPGTYSFGPKDGQITIVRDGMSLMPDNSGYASSVARMDDLIRVLVNNVGLSIPEAVEMASAVPAKIIRQFRKMGSIEPGKDANIVVADSSLKIKATIVRGRKVFG